MSQFQRTGKKIKFNHSNALPRYILSVYIDKIKVYDSDDKRLWHWEFAKAYVTNGRFARGKVVGKTDRTFDSKDEFWAYVYNATRHNYTTWLVGHSILTELILLGLPYRFTCGELSIDKPRSKRIRENNEDDDPHSQALAVLESPPTIIGCRVGQTQGRLVLVDILNWFQGNLSNIKAACGFSASVSCAVRNTCNQSGQAGIENSNAVHSLFEGLIKWVGENQMGLFRYTASSQAMGAFRHRFMSKPIYVHDNEDIQKLERKAYFGGRSDVFKMGEFHETVYQCDTNALFPSVMADGYFPYILNRYENRHEMLELLPSIDWSASVAYVELVTNKPLYPLRTDLHVIYPVGRFRTTLCGLELQRAVSSGCVTRVGSWAEYKLARLFDLWVSELWAMRQKYKTDGNVLYEQFTKKIMNSLYGKFAQLTPSWVNCNTDHTLEPFTTDSRIDPLTGIWTTLRSVGWQCQKLQARKEKAGSFYAIAAFVTSAARCRMDYVRLAAGTRNVYYQGVDCVIVNKKGLDNLNMLGEIVPNELGKLRVEYESDYGRIRGISDYQIGSREVVASRALTAETTDLGEVLQHKYYVMDHLFKNGPIDKLPQKAESWSRSNGYAKGAVQLDGWVDPLELGNMPNSESVGSKPSLAAASAS
jgi:hypothetical protein